MISRSSLLLLTTATLITAANIPFSNLAREVIARQENESTQSLTLQQKIEQEIRSPRQMRSAASCTFTGNVINEDGTPRNSTVRIYDKYGYIYDWASCDDKGKFTSLALPSGEYTFLADWRGTFLGGVSSIDDAEWVTISSGTSDIGTITYKKSTTTETEGDTSSILGILSLPDGSPAGNIPYTITIRKTDGTYKNNGRISGTTDAAGAFVNSYISEAGSYYALLTEINSVPVVPVWEGSSELTAASPKTYSFGNIVNMNFTLRAGGSIRCTSCYFDFQMRRIKVITEEGYELQEWSGNNTDEVTLFNNLPAGKYYIRTDLYDHNPYRYYPNEPTVKTAQLITVSENDTTDVDISFPDHFGTDVATSVFVTVSDKSGKPVSGLGIKGDAGYGESEIIEEANGVYEIMVPNEGTSLTLSIRPEENNIHLQDTLIIINSGTGEVHQSVVLRDAGSIAASIPNNSIIDNGSLQGNYVLSASSEDGTVYSSWATADDKIGRGFHISNVAPGEYSLSRIPLIWEGKESSINSSYEGFPYCSQDVKVANDSISEVELSNGKSFGGISGTYSLSEEIKGEGFALSYLFNSDGKIAAATIIFPENSKERSSLDLFFDRYSTGGSISYEIVFPFLKDGEYHAATALPDGKGNSLFHWYGSAEVDTVHSQTNLMHGKESFPKQVPSSAGVITVAGGEIVQGVDFGADETGISKPIVNSPEQFSVIESSGELLITVPSGVTGTTNLALYSLSGREIAVATVSGQEQFSWNLNSIGVSSGVYIIAMKNGSVMGTEKLILR